MERFDEPWKNQYTYISKIWNTMWEQKKEATQPCYLLETLFAQESPSLSLMSEDTTELFHRNLLKIECVASLQKIQPGFFQFVGYWARLYAIRCKTLVGPLLIDGIERTMIHNILISHCPEQSIEFLNSLSHCVHLLEFILKHLISMRKDRHQLLLDATINFTLNTIKHASLNSYKFDFDNIIQELKETDSNMIRVRNS